MIENGVTQKHRTMFVIVGDKGKDQVIILHHILSKAVIGSRPTVLWCYKKELGFSSQRKKRMKQLQKKIKSGKLDVNEDDPFDLFLASTNVRYCHYSDTDTILGNTYGMCVLQDFEALTPNLLARTIETVEGGGIVVMLLPKMTSMKQLYAMPMDVHARYRTEAHQNVVGRFNERFTLSLASCKTCVVADENFHLLSLSSHCLEVTAVPPKTKGSENEFSPLDLQLEELKRELGDTQPVGTLLNLCKTLDQAKALLKFTEAISDKALHSTVALTAARGRGKSAALGLAISAAIAFSYSNVFVTSPSPENLKTLFEFVLKGLDTLEYRKGVDYDFVQSSNSEFNNAIVRVDVSRGHRQTIQYIHPSDAHKLGQAEMVVIDEAAAIPLPLVKKLLGPYIVFMASTINGYEGTGRSLSLKLIHQLRQQTIPKYGGGAKEIKTATGSSNSTSSNTAGRVLHEVELNESVRYAMGDDVENWLNELLCLDASVAAHTSYNCPNQRDSQLYYINRDTLFSHHKTSEVFLHRLMALYVASHYKNTPNDLQMLSDAPAHHLFCLLGPVNPGGKKLPEILCVVQVCLEGKISKASTASGLSRGKRAAGDLIPWTVAQQFQDEEFARLAGARVVRIATHPDYQNMGYGTRALHLLQEYYEGKVLHVDEDGDATTARQEVEQSQDDVVVDILQERIVPRKVLPPLLLKLSERPAELLDYIGVSFGLTPELLRFWKRSGFALVYLRQTANDLTGEHSCIMLKALRGDEITIQVSGFWEDFRRRFVNLLGYQFRLFQPSFALSILHNKVRQRESASSKTMTCEQLEINLTKYDLKRLQLYSQNMSDYHLVMDLLPILSRLYFLRKLGDVHFSAVQEAILLGLGLQHRTVDDISQDLGLPATQLLGLFNQMVRRIFKHLIGITEAKVPQTMETPKIQKQKRSEANCEVAAQERESSGSMENSVSKRPLEPEGEHSSDSYSRDKKKKKKSRN